MYWYNIISQTMKKIIHFRKFKYKNQKLNENECNIKENGDYRARKLGSEIDE